MVDYGDVREKAMKDTREKMRVRKGEKDKLIVYLVKLMDGVDEASNILLDRFKDSYSLYFPELSNLVSGSDDYLRLVSSLKNRESFTRERVQEILEDEAKSSRVAEASSSSTGADIDEESLGLLLELSESILNMRERRRSLEERIGSLMEEVAPNLRAVVGGSIGARLIAEAGSLEKLMKFPASTVQVLGAEKALFAHLSKGVNPPKHGIIFQFPMLRRSPLDKRGKIARRIAANASIASRIDYFKGSYSGDELRKQLEEDIEKILEE